MSEIPAPTCELDQWVLAEIAKRRRAGEAVTAMVVGTGAETQSLRMAEAGARVLLLTDTDSTAHINVMSAPTKAFAEASTPLPLEPFDIILCQRNLSTVRYAEALSTLRCEMKRLKIGGKLFISLYGIHSELGENYPDGAKLVAERLAPVAPEPAKRYGLTAPVCLYSERNLFSLLMEAGGAVLKTSTSALGHVRGITARI